MLKTSKLLSAGLVLALTACSAPGKYQPPPRAQVDQLPPSLHLTPEERRLCQTWLLKFSATPQQLQESCGSSTDSSNGSKPVGQ